MAPTFLTLCGLPHSWANATAWRILDAQWDEGQRFLATWLAWRDDPQRAAMLHYVALAPQPPALQALRQTASGNPAWQPLLDELTPQWFGLLPGFHRLTLDDGRVLLTLCIGNRYTLIRQQQFVADTVFLGPQKLNDTHWDLYSTKALARCCRRETQLMADAEQDGVRTALTQAGFDVTPNAGFQIGAGPELPLLARFRPRWALKDSRRPRPVEAARTGTCAVVGAGLAGASVAASLARRGWRVQVLDQADRPASEASGLPVGLAAPHISADDCTLSRLSRAGLRMTLHQATQYLRAGTDWGLTGALEYRLDGSAGLPADWPRLGLDWSRPVCHDAPDREGLRDGTTPCSPDVPQVWHRQAAWLKPSELVQAWLSQTGICFQPNAKVASMRQLDGQWTLHNGQGHELARVDRVVIANATSALPLLQRLQDEHPDLDLSLDSLPALHGVRGQLSWDWHIDTSDATFPSTPVNGAGSVVSNIPFEGGAAWFVGASYQPDTSPAWPDAKNHTANFKRLQKLSPELARQLASKFEHGAIRQWKNTRCVSADRLPLVGPLGTPPWPGLWLCAGMGSRGLTFSVLCAELLAAHWCAEPLPVDAMAAQSLYAMRLAKAKS